MTSAGANSTQPADGPSLGIDPASASVTVRDRRVFGPGGSAATRLFLRRAFALSAVRSVTIDRPAGTAVVRHGRGPDGFLGTLSLALRGEVPALGPHAVVDFDSAPRDRLTFFRHGQTVSTWEVREAAPGRLVLRTSERPAVERAAAGLGRVAGVSRARAGWLSGDLVLTFDPTTVSSETLVRMAERPPEPPEDAPVRFGLANATLGLAAVGELAVPALAPVSAVLLVGASVGTVRTAWEQGRRGEFGLPFLYTTILGATLASGQFLASALMAWTFKYWTRRSRNDFVTERKRLLGAASTPHHAADPILVRPGDVLTVSAGDPIPADGRVVGGTAIIDERAIAWGEGVVRRRAGDSVQAGGVVLSGRVQVEARRVGASTRAAAVVRMLQGASRRDAGETAWPGDEAERFAGRAVGPTLATAGLGWLVGGAATAGAILRPDYATGPGAAGSLDRLRHLAEGLWRGLLVRDPGALARVREADVVVIDDHPSLDRLGLELALVQTASPDPDELIRLAASASTHLADDRAAALAAACRDRSLAVLKLEPTSFEPGLTVRHGGRDVRVFDLPANGDPAPPLGVEIDGRLAATLRFRAGRRPDAADAVARLRETWGVPVVLMTHRAEGPAAALAAALGVDRHVSGLSLQDRARSLDACRKRGLRVVWVGDALDAPRLAPLCHLSVAFAGEADVEGVPASVVLLAPGLSRVAGLWQLASDQAETAQAARRLTLGPNLITVAGAFTFGFTSLTAVLISNVATFGVYNRARASLRGVRGRAEPVPAEPLAPPDPKAVTFDSLPREVGVMLLSVGVLGVVLPGVMGAPALVAGGLVLWPKAFRPVESWFARQSPSLHRKGMRQIGRFLTDLGNRFPERDAALNSPD